jgi:hypothetical protein
MNDQRGFEGGGITAGSITDIPFDEIPAIVEALPNDIDLFPGVLADVAQVEEAVQWIEAEAPGVAKSKGPNLRGGVLSPDEGIIRRNGIFQAGALMVYIDPEDFSEE